MQSYRQIWKYMKIYRKLWKKENIENIWLFSVHGYVLRRGAYVAYADGTQVIPWREPQRVAHTAGFPRQ